MRAGVAESTTADTERLLDADVAEPAARQTGCSQHKEHDMPSPNDDRSRVKDPMQDDFRDNNINRGNQIRENKEQQQGQQEQGGQAQGGQGAGSGPGQGTGAGQKK